MLSDYAVIPGRGGRGLFPPPAYDWDFRDERFALRALARQQERRELQTLLGSPVYLRTTMLPLIGGGVLGPARDRHGQDLRWGLWAPHKRALIDIFSVRMPANEETEDRVAFAQGNQLRYAVVRPTMKLTTDSLREWLEEKPA